jgi:hypothetical protein
MIYFVKKSSYFHTKYKGDTLCPNGRNELNETAIVVIKQEDKCVICAIILYVPVPSYFNF